MGLVKATIYGDTKKRDWGQQCADCDHVMPVKTRRRKTCEECGSPDLLVVHITDCPNCGETVTDVDMRDHLEDCGR